MPSGEPNFRVSKILSSPLFLAIVAGLLTALLAPYLIERTKSNMDRNEYITNTQFEIIETLISLSSRYAVSSKFLLLDLDKSNINNLELSDTRLEKYNLIAEETFNNYQVQAYRARMYFADPRLYDEVMNLYQEVASIDANILRLIDRLKPAVAVDSIESRSSEALRIADEIFNFNLASEKLLEKLYSRVGEEAKISEKRSEIGTGEERPTR